MFSTVAPQGETEMKGSGEAVTGLGEEFKWTTLRAPNLNDESAKEVVEAGYLGEAFKGGFDLSRGGMARWVLREIEEGAWIGKAPVLGNKV